MTDLTPEQQAADRLREHSRRRQLGRLLAVALAFELAVTAEVGLLTGAVWWVFLRPVLSD